MHLRKLFRLERMKLPCTCLMHTLCLEDEGGACSYTDRAISSRNDFDRNSFRKCEKRPREFMKPETSLKMQNSFQTALSFLIIGRKKRLQ